MKILFAVPENAWGGFLGLLRAQIPEHDFETIGGFQVESLAGGLSPENVHDTLMEIRAAGRTVVLAPTGWIYGVLPFVLKRIFKRWRNLFVRSGTWRLS